MKFKYWALFRSFPSRMILFQPSGSIVALWVANFMIWRSNTIWWTNWFKICSVLKNQLSKNHSYPLYLQCDALSGVVLSRIITIAGLKSFWVAISRYRKWSYSHVLGDFVSCFLSSFVFLLEGSLQKEIILKMKKKSDPKILTWRIVQWAPSKPPVVRKFIRCFMFANSVSQTDQ